MARPVPGLLDLVGGLVGDLLHAGAEVARDAVDDLLHLRVVEQLAGAGGDLLVALPARLGAEDVTDRGTDGIPSLPIFILPVALEKWPCLSACRHRPS